MTRLGLYALAIWAGLFLPATAAAEKVDVELVFLADASGSIDDGEIRFQRQGYAAAITDPEILAAITGGYEGKIAAVYVEWGDETSQEIVVPWTVIDGETSAARFAKALLETPRLGSGFNAIGSALAAGQALIENNAVDGHRKIIDFAGDSANNFGGIPISIARASAVSADIVINGLAILCHDCTSGRPIDYDLEQAFRRMIVGGPGAFVITVDGRAEFANAVRKKLLLEIASLAGTNRPHGPCKNPGKVGDSLKNRRFLALRCLRG